MVLRVFFTAKLRSVATEALPRRQVQLAAPPSGPPRRAPAPLPRRGSAGAMEAGPSDATGPIGRPAMTEAEVKRSLRTFMITNFLTPITTQAFMPIIALLLVDDLGEPILRVGQLFFTLAAGSFLSLASMQWLLARLPLKTVLLWNYIARTLACLLWVWALQRHAAGEGAAWPPALPGHPPILVSIFASRFFYGLTLNSFAITTPWCGVRLKHEAKPAALARVGGMLFIGILLGPMVGVGIASLSPTPMAGCARRPLRVSLCGLSLSASPPPCITALHIPFPQRT